MHNCLSKWEVSAIHSTIMPSNNKAAGNRHESLIFPLRPTRLHSMLVSCGRETRESCDYSWHGMKRGGGEFAIFQYTLSGAGQLERGGVVRKIRSGEAMIVAVPDDHCYSLPADSPHWEFIYLTLNGLEIMPLWREIIRRHGCVVSLARESAPVKKAEQIIADTFAGRIRNPFRASSLAYDFVMLLLESMVPEYKDEPRQPFVGQISDYCRGHLREELTVDTLAGIAGYSRYHFTRLFRRSTGLAPGDFVQNTRLKESVRLLQTTSMTVKEIADASGYRDCNYFCRVFRKHFGVSPGRFKRNGLF
jgi:AraC family transcriptional regulator